MGPITYVRTWWATTARRLMVSVRRVLAPVVGAAAAMPVSPDYQPINGMSAIAAFPWVWVAAQAVVTDLAGLRLIASRGEGRSAEPVDDHPALELLRRPSRGVSGTRLRRQLVLDYVCTGNAYLYWETRAGVDHLFRLHPQHVQAVVDERLGEVVGYVYQRTMQIPADRVFHVADVSWSDRPNCVLGESAMRSLHEDLTAVRAAKRQATSAATLGRPDMMFSAPTDSPLLSQEAMDGVVEKYEDAMAAGRRAFFTGGGLVATPLSWSPRDLEFTEQRHDTRDAVLAVFGVPPVRAGLPTANYGTAKAQLRMYWERLAHMAHLFDDELTRLAFALTGDSGIRIGHDLSDVEALQTSYDQRQVRAGNWIAIFGADPAEAAAYEGFRDAPTGSASGKVPRRPAKEVDEQQDARRSILAVPIQGYLRGAAARYGELQERGAQEAEWTLALRVEVARFAQLLEAAGVEPEQAMRDAEDICGLHHEVALAGADCSVARAFSTARSFELATRLEGGMPSIRRAA